ncbi:hypothetical protein ISN44_As12g033990 [Arabidopsis suecica]|uniref:Uncharacterized protein n=1 Tax=Arabidopsis suecica TaxID=45249 RepID=A0A8T1YPT2_ARASU|nr:hypothetical protein ISN44_As12g033990 [Arabidopsis suecica]
MSNGRLPDKDDRLWSASLDHLTMIDSNYTIVGFDKLKSVPLVDSNKCYDVHYLGYVNEDVGVSMSYGGPGGFNKLPLLSQGISLPQKRVSFPPLSILMLPRLSFLTRIIKSKKDDEDTKEDEMSEEVTKEVDEEEKKEVIEKSEKFFENLKRFISLQY